MSQLLIQATPTQNLTEQMAVARNPIEVVFFGETTSTSATEVFIDNINNFRIQPPEESSGYIEFVVCGFNVTDSATIDADKTVARFSRLGTTMTVTQGTDVTNVYDDAILTVAADDTNDYITVSVTAADTDTNRWKVYATIYAQAELDNSGDGVYDATQK